MRLMSPRHGRFFAALVLESPRCSLVFIASQEPKVKFFSSFLFSLSSWARCKCCFNGINFTYENNGNGKFYSLAAAAAGIAPPLARVGNESFASGQATQLPAQLQSKPRHELRNEIKRFERCKNKQTRRLKLARVANSRRCSATVNFVAKSFVARSCGIHYDHDGDSLA